MNIFKSITLVFVFLLISGCGDSKKPKEKSIYKRVKTEKKQVKQVNAETPIDLNNKGIGPIKNYNFSSEVNLELANEGKQVFNSKCTACHNVNKRLIGPAMSGIYERRSDQGDVSSGKYMIYDGKFSKMKYLQVYGSITFY